MTRHEYQLKWQSEHKHVAKAWRAKYPEYGSYRGMMIRCYRSSHKSFKYYGALGVKVCARWNGSFKNFLEDMGKRPLRHSLDRINPSGNYEPENCRWATYREQRVNRRITTTGSKITPNGNINYPPPATL